MKGPTWRDLIIPLGMGGGAGIGLLVAVILLRTGESNVRSPGDPGDAAAMFGMFLVFAGTIIGTIIGIVVAVALYLKKKGRPN
jgi:hypothetical protein